MDLDLRFGLLMLAFVVTLLGASEAVTDKMWGNLALFVALAVIVVIRMLLDISRKHVKNP